MHRKQLELIKKDLFKKMVFLVGPRQVGKTRLALMLAENIEQTVYLNYDNLEDREQIRQSNWLPETELLILDEIHKMPEWKNYIKGIYDTKPESLQILVTGSARLETFRQSGDSLAGRFFRHRLNPFSLAEIPDASYKDLEKLMCQGGFPEPFLSTDEVDAKRWRLQYIDGLIRTDILDFEKIHDFKTIQLLLEMLRIRVGSPISYSSLARDLDSSPNTIKRYIEILEALLIIFRITPYHKNIARSLLKEPKIYFFDNGMIKGDKGIQFENLVAVSLLKHLDAIEDYQGIKTQLYYLRTKEKKEVDFVLELDSSIEKIIEVKLSDASLSKTLLYFKQKYNLPAMQLVKNLRNERLEKGIEIRRGFDYLKGLYL